MPKVAILDSGWGGEIFADYLQKEIPTLDIIRVIDWHNAPYDQKSKPEIIKCVEKVALPYIGNVDLIYLANEIPSISALSSLKRLYPSQKFAGATISLEKLAKTSKNQIPIYMTTSWVLNSAKYLKEKSKHPELKLAEPICRNWEKFIDDGILDKIKIEKALNPIMKEKAVYNIHLGCYHFVDAIPILKEIFGWRANIITNFDEEVTKICKILRMRGGSGKK